jgi:hypothetical protein
MVSGPFYWTDYNQAQPTAMSVNTFQAKIALGRWLDQPFIPSINELAEAIRPNVANLKSFMTQ